MASELLSFAADVIDGKRQSRCVFLACFVLKKRELTLERKAIGAVKSMATETHQGRDSDRASRGDTIKMKLDRKTANALIKVALRQRHAPGKYDVFAWEEDRKLRSLTVAWQSYTRRSIDLEKVGIEGGEDIPTNATPLPNGMARNSACYVGSFRIDRPQPSEEA